MRWCFYETSSGRLRFRKEQQTPDILRHGTNFDNLANLIAGRIPKSVWTVAACFGTLRHPGSKGLLAEVLSRRRLGRLWSLYLDPPMGESPMTISRRCVAVAASLLVVAGQAIVVDVQNVNAQILNASVPTSSGGVQTAVGNAEPGKEKGGFLPVSWPSISLPTITMPQIPMPQMSMPTITWPKWPTNADGSAVSPFAPITAGMSKISAGTQKAWEGAKEMFGYGANAEEEQPAASSSEPSFWQRMMGKQSEPSGPRTVAEFMAQPRVGQ